MTVPEHLICPSDVFATDFSRAYNAGVEVWKDSEVAVVGLARNCERPLAGNLSRLVELCSGAKSWQLHIETNDNTDGTEQVLDDFCSQFKQAKYTSQTLGRQQFSAEFAGRRTEALAEYRTACQEWVRDHARCADFVVAIDFDSWGGWSHAGFLHGVGELYDSATAYGMASVSLLQWRQDEAGTEQWVHYDAWALRLNSTWDDYTAGQGGWKHAWLPPVGSPPVPVVSAFGGMAIYETGAYLSGTYDGSDCEHVPFHASIAAKTGKSLYLDPAMRTVMKWLE